MGEPVLAVHGIRKSFGGVEVLHGVDLSAPAGRVVALLGENGAGKSTLVKIISGDYQPDAGTIRLSGTDHAQLSPIAARALGVRMIYQEMNDASSLTVAENVFLGNLPRSRGIVRWREVRRQAAAVLADLQVDLDPDLPMSRLRIGERQVVEIARAIVDDARLLVLDEPTAALSGDETDQLFRFVDRLRDRGTAMIYITHRLDEVRRIADDLVVLRDGNVVLRADARSTDRRTMVEAMVGAAVGDVRRPEVRLPDARTAPAVELVEASSPGSFEGVSLQVRPGEVVALYGKVGAGIAEVAEAVFGLRPLSGGTLRIAAGKGPVSPRQAIGMKVGLLPADRKREGAFLSQSNARNLVAPVWPRLGRGGLWVRDAQERSAFDQWRARLRIRVTQENGARTPIGRLSGGNQQKVLLARWLHAGSQVLVLLEPTRGVDVGARQEIYATIRDLAAEGVAVLVATSDYEEVVQVADRSVVMAGGRVVRELAPQEVSAGALTDAAGG